MCFSSASYTCTTSTGVYYQYWRVLPVLACTTSTGVYYQYWHVLPVLACTTNTGVNLLHKSLNHQAWGSGHKRNPLWGRGTVMSPPRITPKLNNGAFNNFPTLDYPRMGPRSIMRRLTLDYSLNPFCSQSIHVIVQTYTHVRMSCLLYCDKRIDPR